MYLGITFNYKRSLPVLCKKGKGAAFASSPRAKLTSGPSVGSHVSGNIRSICRWRQNCDANKKKRPKPIVESGAPIHAVPESQPHMPESPEKAGHERAGNTTNEFPEDEDVIIYSDEVMGRASLHLKKENMEQLRDPDILK